MVIIDIYFKGLTPHMLHTKFQGDQSSDTEEEAFLDFYNIWACRPPWDRSTIGVKF